MIRLLAAASSYLANALHFEHRREGNEANVILSTGKIREQKKQNEKKIN